MQHVGPVYSVYTCTCIKLLGHGMCKRQYNITRPSLHAVIIVVEFTNFLFAFRYWPPPPPSTIASVNINSYDSPQFEDGSTTSGNRNIMTFIIACNTTLPLALHVTRHWNYPTFYFDTYTTFLLYAVTSSNERDKLGRSTAKPLVGSYNRNHTHDIIQPLHCYRRPCLRSATGAVAS